MKAELTPKQTTSSDILRRSDRVEISIPIEAIGMDLTRGQGFCRKAETLAVSRHGAAIILNYALGTNQELTIRCLTTNEEAEATVVGLISSPGKDLVYGIAFVNPAANPWGIEFPTLTGSDDGLARILLACRLCSAQKIVHLNEIEIQAFEANQTIRQFCNACSETTSWKRLTNKADREPDLPKQTAGRESVSKPKDPVNRRKHGRVRSNVSACIRQAGFLDEIVACENISRGGISCRTSKPYQKGTRIEVAIPYSAGSGNIFVPARIVHVQKSGTFFRLGVEYARISGTQKRAERYSGARTA